MQCRRSSLSTRSTAMEGPRQAPADVALLMRQLTQEADYLHHSVSALYQQALVLRTDLKRLIVNGRTIQHNRQPEGVRRGQR
jgi:1,6-anhydro-N-acetylmuramate kinase